MGGQFGQQLGRSEYLNQQAAAFGNRGTAAGGGMNQAPVRSKTF
jgi:hypothetical protein